MKNLLIVVLAYLAALAVIVPIAGFAVLVLAGPHAGILPSVLEPVAALLGLAAVVLLPALIARSVWRRLRRHPPPGPVA